MITLEFDPQELLDAVRELNFLVISFDRMGSFYNQKPDGEFKEALNSFFVCAFRRWRPVIPAMTTTPIRTTRSVWEP